MTKYLFITLFFTIFFNVNAQDSISSRKNIAVVPFMPHMYFNDLSRLWYKTGESICQEKQLKEISKHVFDNLTDSLTATYNLLDLNQDRTISTTDYLLQFYQNIKITYADTFPQKEQKTKWVKTSNKKHTRSKGRYQGEIKSEKKDRNYQFLNSQIINNREFRKNCAELELDEVLFINQLEIRGDFFSPYNSGQETDYYVIIHYSLYNKNGKLILGNKTLHTTTDEKARYIHFLDHDLKLAVNEINHAILDINRDNLTKLKKGQAPNS